MSYKTAKEIFHRLTELGHQQNEEARPATIIAGDRVVSSGQVVWKDPEHLSAVFRPRDHAILDVPPENEGSLQLSVDGGEAPYTRHIQSLRLCPASREGDPHYHIDL